MNRLDLERKSSDARLGFRDLLAQIVDLARQPAAGGFRLLLPRVLLQHQIAVGDRIGDARGELRIARLEFDDDDARLVHRIRRVALEIGVQHALFRRQRERIAADSEQRQQRLQRRKALQHRIEFRALGQLVLLDDLARQIARQQQLHLAGDGLGVDRIALVVALAVRPQEHVLAAIDQDARFGFVSRGDHVDGGERQHQRHHRRNDDPAALAHQGLTERMQVEIAGFRRGDLLGGGGLARRRARLCSTACAAGAGFATLAPPRPCPCLHARTLNASHTPADATDSTSTGADYTPLRLPLG